MQTFYSLIKIAPNTLAGDSLSIGLIVCSNNKYFLKFSLHKLNTLKRLMPNNKSLIDFSVEQITNHIKQIKKLEEKSNAELFPLDQILKSEYFNYLTNYSNGVLQFSKPNLINDSVDDEKFNKLFSMLVDDTEIVDEKIIKTNLDEQFLNNVNSKLISKVSDRIHTNYKFTNKELPSLYFPIEIDCIGLNGSFVGAKSISFNKSAPTLDREISHYSVFINLLINAYSKQNNNFFLIADEPSSVTSEEHKTWESMHAFPFFNLIHSEQASIVADKVLESDAKEFIKKR